MSFKVTKVAIGKGYTRSDKEDGSKTEYIQLEAEIEDEKELEYTKDMLSNLVDIWLKGKTLNDPLEPITNINLTKKNPLLIIEDYSIDKISWEDREGPRGPYQISEDVNGQDFRALQTDLKKHNGKMRMNGFFFWQFDQNPNCIGKKKID